MIDKTDLLRKILLEVIKKDKDKAFKEIHDKIILLDFLSKVVRAERREKTEENKLAKFLKE